MSDCVDEPHIIVPLMDNDIADIIIIVKQLNALVDHYYYNDKRRQKEMLPTNKAH